MGEFKMNSLNDAQIKELGLWEELLSVLTTLEIREVLEQIKAKRDIWNGGWRIWFKDSSDEFAQEYLVFLDPLEFPLRVKWGKGSGAYEPMPFSFTECFLRSLISHFKEIESNLGVGNRPCVKCFHQEHEHDSIKGKCGKCGCPRFTLGGSIW